MGEQRWVRRFAWAGALVLAYAAGVASKRFWVPDAHAQASTTPVVATMYIPSGGLVFRTPDGRPVARLSRDAHGGLFELFDEHDTAMSAVPRQVPSPFGNARQVKEPYVLDDEDPFLDDRPSPARGGF
jgi:hypothetical protein